MTLPGGANFSHAADYHSPRSSALGGAGHAGPFLNDAIYLNPSYAAFFPIYAISANLGYYGGGSVQPMDDKYSFRGRNLNFSLQDGRTELFQAGVGYTIRDDARVFNFGAAKAVVKRLGVGIGGKMILPNAPRNGRIVDTTFSSSLIVTDWFHVVVVIDNLIESGKEEGFLRDFLLGTKFNLKGICMLYFDPHLTPSVTSGSAYGHNIGVEFAVMSDLFLRMGMFKNSYVPYEAGRGRGFGSGIGWIAPRLSLDYGISRVIEPVSATMHNLGMTVYF